MSLPITAAPSAPDCCSPWLHALASRREKAAAALAEIPRILLSDRVSGLRSRGLAFLALARIRLHRARIMIWLVTGGDPALLSGGWNRE
jgi:hypothetical protein